MLVKIVSFHQYHPESLSPGKPLLVVCFMPVSLGICCRKSPNEMEVYSWENHRTKWGFCSRPRLIPGGYKSIYGIDIPVGSDCCWFVLNNALYVICVFMVSMRCNQVPFTSANFCGLIGTLLSHTIHMSDETNAHIHIYIHT